jgi:hypothetical protein
MLVPVCYTTWYKSVLYPKQKQQEWPNKNSKINEQIKYIGKQEKTPSQRTRNLIPL